MKVLFNKLKKTNKIFLAIYFLSFVIYFITYVLLVKNLVALSGIETLIRYLVIGIFGIWLLVYFIWNLINLILKRHVTIAITTSITIIFIVLFGFANYYISMIYTGIDNLSESEYVTYTSNLVALNTTTIDENSKLGMINSSDDIEGNVLAKELIKDKGLNDNEVIEYSSYYEMIYDLINGEVDGIFLTSNYMTIFGSEEGFEELKNTIIVYSYSKKMVNQDTAIVSHKSLKEPFTILLMGVDSEANGLDANASFNGDTLMMITFNPKTLNATMFSIPRDTYVPIACNNNRYAKINSSAAYGTSCVIDTVKQLTGINIDYYVKINFKGVVDLVEALGGVDVNVEAPDYSVYIKAHNGKICEQNSLRQFGDQLVCMDPGEQHLNGEQALAYARCRHAYLQSDIARNRHQQQIVEAIAKKVASPSNINKVEDLLNAVTNNLATNMSQKQILSFYDVMKNMISKSLNEGEFITIQKTYMEYYSLPVKLSANGIFTSAIGHYPDSLGAIVNLMKANLGLEEKEMIKTFSFDANEEYTSKVTGQGITTGAKLETMPNFVGLTVSQADEWATTHNVTITKEFVDNSSIYYNSNIAPGLISNQSYAYGLLVNGLTNLTIYINDGAPSNNPTLPNNSNNNQNNNSTNTSEENNTGENDNTDNKLDEPLDIVLPSESSEQKDNTSEETSQE